MKYSYDEENIFNNYKLSRNQSIKKYFPDNWMKRHISDNIPIKFSPHFYSTPVLYRTVFTLLFSLGILRISKLWRKHTNIKYFIVYRVFDEYNNFLTIIVINMLLASIFLKYYIFYKFSAFSCRYSSLENEFTLNSDFLFDMYRRNSIFLQSMVLCVLWIRCSWRVLVEQPGHDWVSSFNYLTLILFII